MASTAQLPTAADILAKFYTAETAYMRLPPHERDFMSGMGAVLSPNFISYQSPDLPWGGEWKGRVGFQRWSETMAGIFEGLEVLDPKIYVRDGAEGGDGSSVLVESTLRLTVRGSGKVWEAPLVQTIVVDRQEGWIESIRPFYWDVAGLRGLLGM